MKVLVTCGPTWVPIDDVRVISNISSGAMGQAIAKEFKKKGWRVTLIEGPVTEPLKIQGIKVLKFCYYDELAAIIKKEILNKYDVIVHAAAVSDYKPKQVIRGKINSQNKISLELVPTSKIIGIIKKNAPQSCLVGFKLEPDLIKSKVFKYAQKLVQSSGCDLVVVNSIKNIYHGYISDADGHVLYSTNSKLKLAKELVRILS